MKPFAIGELRIDRVEELCGAFVTPDEFIADLPPDCIERNINWLAPNFFDVASGRMINSIHSWIVRTLHHTVLIDTCYGNYKSRPGQPGDRLDGPWLSRLEERGLRPEDIDFVMCTHLHADHVGWNTRLLEGRWVPTFPNARYLFGRREYEYWRTATGPAATEFGQQSVFGDSVLPCIEAGQVQFVDNGFELDDALLVQDAPGHTPGNAILRARSRGQTGLFIGDIMHTPLQVPYPDANSRADIDPAQSRATRRRVLSECAEHGHLLLPAHFGPPFYGRVTHDGGAYAFRPAE